MGKQNERPITHWVKHICVSKLTIIGSDNGLSPGRRQAISWTNATMLLIRTLGTNFSEILSEIRAFSFKNMDLKMSSAKWRRFCLGLNVLMREALLCLDVILNKALPTIQCDDNKCVFVWKKCALKKSRIGTGSASYPESLIAIKLATILQGRGAFTEQSYPHMVF